MSHRFLEGSIYHKRFFPKKHDFKYGFFMVDIDVKNLNTLKSKLFSVNKRNIFSFFSKDHFGKSEDFVQNANSLAKTCEDTDIDSMRFITLPRMFGFVFNPISILLLLSEGTPKHMFVEVHNYNGGRVLYPVSLHSDDNKTFKGTGEKDMYVSPFLKRDGLYEFTMKYTQDSMSLNILLKEDGKKILNSSLSTKSLEFSDKSIRSLLLSHTFLSLFVVTRTLWQTLKLLLKGLKFTHPIQKDQIKRI